MPVLESPEVQITATTSGLIMTTQPVNRTLADAGYETDVGMLDPMGLNVLCNAIQIYHPPVAGDYKSSIRMSFYLSEQWNQKDAFLARMQKEHNIPVREENMAWGGTLTHITVSGQENIQRLSRHLRTSFAETVHEDATIHRQIVNPALLGSAVDAMNDAVAKSQSMKPSKSWQAAALEYGWRA